MKKILAICGSLLLIMFLYAVIHSEYDNVTDKLEEKFMGVNTVKLPFEESEDFYFSSGAGAWGTEMTVFNGGHFKGNFHDTNMGETGDKYPNGTVYMCDFSGEFTEVKKIDKYSYSMKLGNIKPDKEPETEELKDNIRYIYAEPYGLEDGEEFILYLPETPTEGLSEEFLSWWPGRFKMGGAPETLSSYGILNKSTGQGFFSDMIEE